MTEFILELAMRRPVLLDAFADAEDALAEIGTLAAAHGADSDLLHSLEVTATVLSGTRAFVDHQLGRMVAPEQ